MSIREWDIPLEELKVGDKIGTGRFSTVHAGNWHGDVAIKFLDMENVDDESSLEAFKLDVATFRWDQSIFKRNKTFNKKISGKLATRT